MYAIGIGYPLEIQDNSYDVEIGHGITTLNSNEASVWLNFNSVRNIVDMKGNDAVFEQLVEKGALKKAETLQGLLCEIKDAVPIRQGAGTFQNNGNIICIGEKQVALSKIDYEVWKLATGKINVEQIWISVSNTFHIDAETLIRSISLLDEMDLIFLR